MGQVSHEQADLLLKLYDLRRETKLREARSWFAAEFWASSPEEMMQKYPPNTDANAKMRMVMGYWEMACGLLNRGLMDDELFFESSAEFWFAFEKIRPMVPALRAMFGNPLAFHHMEAAVGRLEQHWARVAPGMVEFHRKRMAQMREASAKAAHSS